MTALLVALTVVGYFAIGAVIAGVADRDRYREDRNGPFIAPMWPFFLATWLLVGVAYVAHVPFRAIYRRARGAK